MRQRVINELEEKVAHHSSGGQSNQVSIREGIYEASLKKDLERLSKHLETMSGRLEQINQ